MAENIGTQLVEKLEEISRLSSVMGSLSSLGTGLTTFNDMQCFVNIVEFIEGLHSDAFDSFHTYMLQRVVPIMRDINAPVFS